MVDIRTGIIVCKKNNATDGRVGIVVVRFIVAAIIIF